MKFKFPKSEGDLIESVIALGTKNSRTLGHFPSGAFREQTKKKLILCALTDTNELMGYILFGIAQSKMRLRVTHLCVAEEHRGKGVARGLLDEIKKKYQFQLKSMGLSCRKDYIKASEFWAHYGFKPYRTVRSRSKAEKYLVKWLYEFGNLDLFSIPDTEGPTIQALLDVNVIIKMRDATDADSTQDDPLLADWLIDEVEYYFAPELMSEIHRDADKERIKQTRIFCTRFKEAKFRPDKRDRIAEDLKSYIKGTSDNDVSDRIQLAECIASNIDYFITSDSGILSVEQQVFKEYGVQICSPPDFVLMLDEIQNKTNFQASRIAGVNLEYRQIKPGEIEGATQKMLSKENQEKKHEFKEVLNSIVLNRGVGQVQVLKNRDKDFLGLYTQKFLNNYVCVERIRTSKSKLSKVLFIQLVFDILRLARTRKTELIEISDPWLTKDQEVVLQSFGFTRKTQVWVKVCVYGVHNSVEAVSMNSSVEHVFDREELIQNLRKHSNTEVAIKLERRLWPVKFTDIDIPCYLIPIKPYWASELFDFYAAEKQIFGAKPHLSWNRENVYYRSVNPVSEQAPGRILWYVSSSTTDDKQRCNAVVATSYIDDVIVGSAKTLFKAFKSYGIYEWGNILDQAKGNPNGDIKAIKFSDTEVFENSVSFEKVNEILEAHSRSRNTFPSPLLVSKEIFMEIYLNGIR